MDLKILEQQLESELFKLAEQKKVLADKESSLLIELYKVRGKIEVLKNTENLYKPESLLKVATKKTEALTSNLDPQLPENQIPITGVGNTITGATFV